MWIWDGILMWASCSMLLPEASINRLSPPVRRFYIQPGYGQSYTFVRIRTLSGLSRCNNDIFFRPSDLLTEKWHGKHFVCGCNLGLYLVSLMVILRQIDSDLHHTNRASHDFHSIAEGLLFIPVVLIFVICTSDLLDLAADFANYIPVYG